MADTLQQLIERSRSVLNESTARFWTDEELTVWINDAQRDIARRTECLQTRTTVAATATIQTYALPTDVIRVHRVQFQRTGDSQIYALNYRDFQNMDEIWWSSQAITSGHHPQWFTMWGFPPSLTMTVYPTPANNGSFSVFYYRLPAALTSSASVMDLPSGWEDLVVAYVEMIALRKDRDPTWQDSKAIYEAKLSDMWDLTRRWSDQGGVVVSDTGGYFPAWLVNGD